MKVLSWRVAEGGARETFVLLERVRVFEVSESPFTVTLVVGNGKLRDVVDAAVSDRIWMTLSQASGTSGAPDD